MNDPPASPDNPIPAPEPPPRPGLGPGMILGLVLQFFLISFGLGAVIALGWLLALGAGTTPPPWVILMTGQVALLAAATLGLQSLELSWRQVLARPVAGWRRGGPLMLAWLVFLVLETLFLDWAFTRWPSLEASLPAFDFAWAALPVILLGPVAEEAFFRGVVCEGLARRYGQALGIVVSSALFALVHGSWVLLPICFVFGLIMGLLQQRTGSILLCIAIHILNNALATLSA